MLSIQDSIEIHSLLFKNLLREEANLKECFYISIAYHILMFILLIGIISDIIRFRL